MIPLLSFCGLSLLSLFDSLLILFLISLLNFVIVALSFSSLLSFEGALSFGFDDLLVVEAVLVLFVSFSFIVLSFSLIWQNSFELLEIFHSSSFFISDGS